MADFLDRVQQLWDSAKSKTAKTRAHFTIKDKNGAPFEAGEHYFQIIISEMFLAKPGMWWVTYDPLALVVSSYIYGKAPETVPSVVGPALFKQYSEDVGLGYIIRDAPVTGMHPYQGGAVTLTVLFNRVQHQNNAEQVLQVVERIAGVINPVTPLVPFPTYLKIAGSVMDGLETLLDLPQTAPVLGYRWTINPQLVGQVFEPAYLVLIDEDEALIDPSMFFVRDSRLYSGDDEATAQPYKAHDFILLHIAQGVKRTDERTLDFYPLWEKARDLAEQASTDHFWSEAKSYFNTLKRNMLASSDLVRPDFKRLIEGYLAEMGDLRKQAVGLSTLSAKELSADEKEMLQISKELDDLDEL